MKLAFLGLASILLINSANAAGMHDDMQGTAIKTSASTAVLGGSQSLQNGQPLKYMPAAASEHDPVENSGSTKRVLKTYEPSAEAKLSGLQRTLLTICILTVLLGCIYYAFRQSKSNS